MLIFPGMAFEVIVEGVVAAIEIFDLVVLLKTANNDAHSIAHSANQGFCRAIRLLRGCEFSQTFQFALGPFDFYTWQGNVGSDSFQSWKKKHRSLPGGALAHNPAPQFPLRHGPSKQRHGIRQKVGVARELQFFFE